jgi:hypothetical protein
MLLIVAMALCGLTGCFTMDAEHNKAHWETVKVDMREWHSDLDFILGLDEPSLLQSHYR